MLRADEAGYVYIMEHRNGVVPRSRLFSVTLNSFQHPSG
jgi:hypothetical protein